MGTPDFKLASTLEVMVNDDDGGKNITGSSSPSSELSPQTLTLRQSETQIAVTAIIIQQTPEAQDCRNVSRINSIGVTTFNLTFTG